MTSYSSAKSFSMAIVFLAFTAPLLGHASPIEKIMNLRLEVEEKNTLWEQEKKRLQGEYETILNRTNEVQADVLRKRSQLEVLRARAASSLKRTERRQTVSGLDRKNLLEAVSELKAGLMNTMPFGRSEHRAKVDRLIQDLTEGRGSVDEVAVDFAQILKSELKLSRGVHVVKEEIQVDSETVSVEAALIGGYAGFFAASDGRVGSWSRQKRQVQWVKEESEKARLLSQLEIIRKSASAHRPVILDLNLEAQ